MANTNIRHSPAKDLESRKPNNGGVELPPANEHLDDSEPILKLMRKI